MCLERFREWADDFRPGGEDFPIPNPLATQPVLAHKAVGRGIGLGYPFDDFFRLRRILQFDADHPIHIEFFQFAKVALEIHHPFAGR